MLEDKEDIVNQFFAPIQNEQVPEEEYKQVEILPQVCEKVARMNNQSIYIIDYSKKNFFFVSSHPLFLCGYTAQEVKEMGYSFYEKVLSPEDLQMLLNINKFGWELFYNVAPAERQHGFFSYDFYLHSKNGVKTLVNHKLSPIFLTPNNNIWLALCSVTLSAQKSRGNVVFTLNNVSEYYLYDFEEHRTIAYNLKQLIDREREIFSFLMRGFNDVDIAKELGISTHTVRTHHKKIITKLGGGNSVSAVTKFSLRF